MLGQFVQRQLDDRARLDADDRVEDEARRARGQVDEVLDAQLQAAQDVQAREQVVRQGRHERRDRRGRDAVVAAIGIPADDDLDEGLGEGGRHGAASIVRSRKWVAHEMHGS